MEKSAQSGFSHHPGQHPAVRLPIDRHLLVGPIGCPCGSGGQSQFPGIFSYFIGWGGYYDCYHGNGFAVQGIEQSATGRLQLVPIHPGHILDFHQFIRTGILYRPAPDDTGRSRT